VIVREPAGPIQVAPAGLLGLLSLKTGGTMPDAMRQDLQPTIDFEGWWLRGKRVVDNNDHTAVLAAATYDAFQDFSTNPIAVPEREWWYVHSYSCKAAITDVADSIQAFRMAVAWTSVGTIRYRFVGEAAPPFITNAACPRATLLAEGFWCPPGSRIGFYTGAVAGIGGLAVNVRGLDYTVCPV